MGSGFGGGFLFMWLFWILVIVVVALVIKCLVGDGCNPSEETSLDKLKKRFERGEIDEDEYNQKKSTLDK